MTTPQNNKDFYKLTFSQREGLAPLPEPMQLKHVPQKFRQMLWSAIDTELVETRDWGTLGSWQEFSVEANLGTILHDYELNILEKFHDDLSGYSLVGTCQAFFKELICEDHEAEDYHEILTVIEFILRHEACSESLYNNLIDVFENTQIAYYLEEIEGLPTIIPRISIESGQATQQAIEVIQQVGLRGASTHLRQAVEHINAEQYHDSISDSISAVESVARQISPEAKTLGQALKLLEKKELITNQQLKDGFEKLYAYTNSEKGIRHALMDDAKSNVGLEEAMFMFGACASFAAYLVNKHQQLQRQQDGSQ